MVCSLKTTLVIFCKGSSMLLTKNIFCCEVLICIVEKQLSSGKAFYKTLVLLTYHSIKANFNSINQLKTSNDSSTTW
jgi:hypothetical protein